MARPIKDGVDYFPKDTDFYGDDKVRLLRAEFGAKGMYILDYILCDLYGKNGYFTKWDKNKCFLVSDGAGCGCDPGFVGEFIDGCIRCSFFDKGVFEMFGVLTSTGIQRRYIRMFNGREEIQIHKEYWLLDKANKKDVPVGVLGKLALKSIKITENPNKTTENPDKNTGNTQSKVNKSKVNKTKVNPIPEEIGAAWSGYVDMRQKIKRPLTEGAVSLALKTLNELAPDDFEMQRNILNQSVFHSWVGLFALKSNGFKGAPQKNQIPTAADYAHKNDFLEGE